MKICVAQTRPEKGDWIANFAAHKKLIRLASAQGAEYIFFPELSMTGYEPTLAKELAIKPDDSRLEEFQRISNERKITIAAGIPVKRDGGVQIGMIIFQPQVPQQVYAKQHLHKDELPYFTPGTSQIFIGEGRDKIVPGICYETSLASHWENAHKNDGAIYIASVAKTAAGVERCARFFAEMARKYKMHVLLSNCVGPSDNFVSGGNSAVWDNAGKLVAHLDDVNEGILVYDTLTGNVAMGTLFSSLTE